MKVSRWDALGLLWAKSVGCFLIALVIVAVDFRLCHRHGSCLEEPASTPLVKAHHCQWRTAD